MKFFAYSLLITCLFSSTGCTIISVADAVVSTAIDVTVGTAKVATKATTAIIGAAIPDNDEDD